jgi:hypothetical protein
VYVVPLVRPLTVIGDAAAAAVAGVPGGLVLHVAVYDVIALPLLGGGVNETCADMFPGSAVGGAGVPGTSTGVTAADVGDSGPSPTVLVAWTVHV